MNSSYLLQPEPPSNEINYEGLKESLQESIGILKTLEGLPRDVKIYRDSEGKIAPSAGAVVSLIERMKPDQSTMMGWMLKTVSKGAQAASRSWYKEDYQGTRRAIQEIEDEILASLLMTEEAIGEPGLSHIDLLKLKNHIGDLRQQFLASRTGLENLVKTYEQKEVEEPIKQETIKQAVEHLDRSLDEEIHSSLAKIDARLAQLSIPIEPQKVIEIPLEKESFREETPSPRLSSLKSIIEESPAPPISESVVEEMLATPLNFETAAKELDFSLDISKELEAAKPKTDKEKRDIATQAARAFERLHLGGMEMKEILNGLSQKQVYCLRCYVVSYWKHRCFHNEIMSADDSRTKMLAPLRFGGLPLKEALDQLKAPQLVLLKDRLVRYWFTFGK